MALEPQTHDLVCGIPFFRRHSDIALFQKLGFACVYAVGPLAGRPMRIGWTSSPSGRFSNLQSSHWKEMKIHDIVWTPGKPLAQRLDEEVNRLLTQAGRHLRGDWFDVTPEMIVPTLQVATDNLKIPTFTHEAMLQRFEEAKEMRASHVLKGFGSLIAAA
ncbi:hypothetical protein [uncultured Methylobacterium sp.]|jgi:hypothetical protein|uniref:hypothetical protein n=1 Tax=uncultured Methylobacterium sp. TaxID=157278 RepID=UPI002624FF3E|nr:hypothetical protein [uncultured Methylobacterium sp.]